MDNVTVLKYVEEGKLLARKFGDRQNSESTLTAREATLVVNFAINVANNLEMLVRTIKEKEVEWQKNQSTPNPT